MVLNCEIGSGIVLFLRRVFRLFRLKMILLKRNNIINILIRVI